MPITEYTEKPNSVVVPPTKFVIIVNDDNVIISDGILTSHIHNNIFTHSKIVTGTKLQIEAYIKSNNLTFNEED